MLPRDVVSMTINAIGSHPLRSGLSLLGIAIGVTTVIVLTSLGEGTRQYILTQFTQFGTNLIAINPGKTKTVGIPGVLGGTTHKLSLDDARSLRRVPGVERIVPIAMGTARVEAHGRSRSITVFGVSSDMPDAWKFRVRQGVFLPEGDLDRRTPVAVLGPKVQRELFGDMSGLGRFVRIAGWRLRVIGILAPKGTILGFDVDDAVYIPVATAMKMFNMEELLEIDVTFAPNQDPDHVVEQIRNLLIQRHRNTEDFTITTQATMLRVLDNVLRMVTLAAGIIAGISLLVGGIGILTILWISVHERTSELGLYKAVGATSGQIYRLIIMESACLSAIGGGIGLAGGLMLFWGLQWAWPGLPLQLDQDYLLAALVMSLVMGILSGLLPATRAASIDPVDALHAE